jgi:hypothetical protein
MPAVYILQSQSNNRFYIGCAEDPVLRLTEHQRGQRYRPEDEDLGPLSIKSGSVLSPRRDPGNVS